MTSAGRHDARVSFPPEVSPKDTVCSRLVHCRKGRLPPGWTVSLQAVEIAPILRQRQLTGFRGGMKINDPFIVNRRSNATPVLAI